jgi:hypothetical protein
MLLARDRAVPPKKTRPALPLSERDPPPSSTSCACPEVSVTGGGEIHVPYRDPYFYYLVPCMVIELLCCRVTGTGRLSFIGTS